MPEIIPAILTDDKQIFKEQVNKAVEFEAKTVQIDFTDGKFVSSKTLLPDELDSFVISRSGLIFEAHLMTEQPDQYFPTLYALGFQRIAAHYQALSEISQTIAKAKDLGVEFGLAINPEVELSKIEPFIEKLDFILFLTVVPGEQGHPFVESTLEKIHLEYLHQLKHKHKDVIIEVDGGVNLSNVKQVIKAGAERIVVGSGIWRADHPLIAYQKLLQN